MLNQNFAADEFVDGNTAARTGVPFNDFSSRPWQQGWTFQKRQQALRDLGPLKYGQVERILEVIGMLCNLLNSHPPIAADLGRAIALRALDGQHIDRDAHPSTQNAVELVA